MSARLDALVAAAREARPRWDGERAERVLAHTLAERAARTRRERVVRRTVAGVSVAAALGLLLVRGASSPAGATTSPSEYAAESSSAGAEVLAASVDGDAGYARD